MCSWNIRMLCGHQGVKPKEAESSWDPHTGPLSALTGRWMVRLSGDSDDCLQLGGLLGVITLSLVTGEQTATVSLLGLASSNHQEIGTERLCCLPEVTQRMSGRKRESSEGWGPCTCPDYIWTDCSKWVLSPWQNQELP